MPAPFIFMVISGVMNLSERIREKFNNVRWCTDNIISMRFT